MENIKNLDDVKVGDLFAMKANSYNGTSWVQVKCTKVTPAQCVIGTISYRKKDARSLGYATAYYHTLYVLTDHILDDIEKSTLIHVIEIRKVDYKIWGMDDLKILKSLLDKYKK